LALLRHGRQDPFHQIAMRIEKRDSLPRLNVLPDHRLQQRRFPGPIGQQPTYLRENKKMGKILDDVHDDVVTRHLQEAVERLESELKQLGMESAETKRQLQHHRRALKILNRMLNHQETRPTPGSSEEEPGE